VPQRHVVVLPPRHRVRAVRRHAAAGALTQLTWSYEDELLVVHAPEHVPVTTTCKADHIRRRPQDANAMRN